jgi:hypothetical protein
MVCCRRRSGTGFHAAETWLAVNPKHHKTHAIFNPPAVVVSIVIRSDCDSGECAPECLPAEMTITMAAYKQGLFKFPAHELAGEIRLVSIGLPGEGEALSTWRRVRSFIPEMEWVRSCLPDRPSSAHKGSFGTALIAAGSIHYTGAAWLAGTAAYRIGAGLVTMASRALCMLSWPAASRSHLAAAAGKRRRDIQGGGSDHQG